MLYNKMATIEKQDLLRFLHPLHFLNIYFLYLHSEEVCFVDLAEEFLMVEPVDADALPVTVGFWDFGSLSSRSIRARDLGFVVSFTIRFRI